MIVLEDHFPYSLGEFPTSWPSWGLVGQSSIESAHYEGWPRLHSTGMRP